MQQDLTLDPTGREATSLRTWSISLARQDRNRAVVTWLFLAILFRTALAAPIRAFLPQLWYVPDFTMLIGFGILLNFGMRYNVIKTAVFMALLIVLFAYALMTNSFLAVSLQARQIGYILMACLVGMGVRTNSHTVPRAIMLIGIIAIVGVYWDYFFKVPWSGAIFSGALQPAEVTREWWSVRGVRRLSGFGISSTDTSAIIAVGCLTACAFLRSRLLGILYAAAAVHTLLLTTQKATAGWVIVMLAVFYVPIILSVRMDTPKRIPVFILKALAISGLVACVMFPAISYNIRWGDMFGVNAPTLDQRTAEVWPTIIPYLFSFPQFLLGYGMGAIGSTATNADLILCDNMFLYVALNVGVPIAAAMFIAAGVAMWKAPARFDRDSYALAVAALLILNGITANVLGAGGVNGTYLGFAVGLMLRPKPRSSRSPANAPTSAADPSISSAKPTRRRRTADRSRSG